MSFPQAIDKRTINPDLVAERERATFNVDAMTEYLYGKAYISRLNRIKKLFAHNPKFDLTDLWHLNKYDRYMRATERAEEIVRLARTYKLNDEDMHMIELLVGEDLFLHLHLTMFIPTLENMADDEQVKEWVPLAKDFRIFGTYAQTELGHGSNVPGLETTAVFDVKTDSWIVNTPTLTATKWWPGGLAKSATHCVLMAQLIIGDKNYGPHPFYFPVRSLDNHESLPGIFLADIGQKLGYNGMDNGCMQIQNVSIPRRNLLMRYCHVDEQGTYKKQGNQRMMYGAMTFTRKQIILNAGPALAKAATIAVRYSAVRRQFSSLPPKEVAARILAKQPVPEAAVLDYSSQMYMLIPLIAQSYAFIATSDMVNKCYTRMMANVQEGNFDMLAETHIITSALKATLTMQAFDGIEACRKACGGHGFLVSSGLPGHLANYAPQPTYEGDFVVLSIQTGRALLKEVARVTSGKASDFSQKGTASYLTAYQPGGESNFPFDTLKAPEGGIEGLKTNSAWLLEALRRRASILVYGTAKEFMTNKANGMSVMEALDSVKIEFTRITVAHAQLLCYQAFVDKIRSSNVSEKEATTLNRLASLFALYSFDKHSIEFLQAGVLESAIQVAELILPAVKSLLAELRSDAVALVDAWNFPDYFLNSTLGRYDGRAYEALFDSVKFDANNKTDVHESYFKHLQYILHPERKVQGSFIGNAFTTKL